MTGITVFFEQQAGSLQKASLVALSAARKIATAWDLGSLCGVVLGKGSKQAADAIAALGVSKVYYSEESYFEHYLAVPYAQALQKVMESTSSSVAVGAATTTGKDFFPRVAASLDGAQASDIIAVNDDGTLTRPMYAGDVFADIEVHGDKKLVTVRPTGFEPATASGEKGSVEALPSIEVSKIAGEFLRFEGSGGDRPDLGDASVVVSGGRALASSENFEKVLFPLADVLNAAVGASRAAVDSGYAPNDWQVGQTGKVVAPQLYVAVGISGAIQHLAGMKGSKVIVAINKDPDAPIFEIADYGLVADLFEAVPALTEAIRSAKSAS